MGGSDHGPVFLTIDNEGITSTPQKVRWNYKKARWGLFQHRTKFLTKDLVVEGRDINRVVQEFNPAVLQATKEAIPRGARKEYRNIGRIGMSDSTLYMTILLLPEKKLREPHPRKTTSSYKNQEQFTSGPNLR